MFDATLVPRSYDHVPLPMPICSEQLDTVTRYMSNAFWAKKERVFEFYQGERGEIFVQEVWTAATTASKIGAVIGAAVSITGNLAFELYVPRPITWTMRLLSFVGYTVAGGAVGGTAAGVSAVVLKSVVKLHEDTSTTEYYRWRLAKMNDSIWDSFESTIHREDLNLLGFICPISQDLIEVPYTTKNGLHTFEKDELLRWLTRVTPMVERRAAAAKTEEERQLILFETSPYQDEHITMENVCYDIYYHSKLCSAINGLIEDYNDMNMRKLPAIAVEGLNKIKQSVRMPASKVLDEPILINNHMLILGQINETTHLERIRALNDHYRPFLNLPVIYRPRSSFSDHSVENNSNEGSIAAEVEAIEEFLAQGEDGVVVHIEEGTEETKGEIV